ncbi:TRAP transporter small permease [Litoreibacter albidus]|uniref:TRAP transporter small permease protein n=1 Tax=Litoreibacter albidus TaxID=670155 RepID=A0A1H3CK86_9RHOB|nr:TRAP transporter small permease [Litoreibacter albidus]SDX54515.1 TRAP-type mannitol/chloroaromatic compound transport system, small permease component [Litoreibacter albidus]
MHRATRFVGQLAALQLAISAIAVLAILVTVSMDVVMRAAFNAPFSSTIEIVSYYYMIPMAFLPLAMLELRGEHIDTELLYNLMPSPVQKLSTLVAGMLACLIYAVLTYYSFKQAMTSTTAGELAMGVNLLPIWPVRWIMPVAFFMGIIAALLLTLQRLFNTGADHE